MRIIVQIVGWCCLTLGFIGCSDPDAVPESHISAMPPLQPTSTDVERFPLKTALFGDLHVHTSWSTDAYAGGNRLGPNSAYQFAKGEKVELPNGVEAQLHAPLDFVALTDHAEGFGTQPDLHNAGLTGIQPATVPGIPIRGFRLGRHARAGILSRWRASRTSRRRLSG